MPFAWRCEFAPWSDVGRSTLRPYARKVAVPVGADLIYAPLSRELNLDKPAACRALPKQAYQRAQHAVPLQLQLAQNGAPLRLASAGDATADRGKENGIGRCASFLSHFRRKTRR